MAVERIGEARGGSHFSNHTGVPATPGATLLRGHCCQDGYSNGVGTSSAVPQVAAARGVMCMFGGIIAILCPGAL
eukprot:218259-Amphidinium_carterae.2